MCESVDNTQRRTDTKMDTVPHPSGRTNRSHIHQFQRICGNNQHHTTHVGTIHIHTYIYTQHQKDDTGKGGTLERTSPEGGGVGVDKRPRCECVVCVGVRVSGWDCGVQAGECGDSPRNKTRGSSRVGGGTATEGSFFCCAGCVWMEGRDTQAWPPREEEGFPHTERHTTTNREQLSNGTDPAHQHTQQREHGTKAQSRGG